jgi:hypothetical protein
MDFMYRVPGQEGLRTQQIRWGSQVQLSGDLSTPEIEGIVEQHTIYGMIHVSEIDQARPFIGLCWQLDKPIPVAKLQAGAEHNVQILNARGEAIRKESAVAAAVQTEQSVHLPIREFEVSVTEEVDDGGTPSINSGVRVTADPDRAAVLSEGRRFGRRKGRRSV